MLKKMRLTTKNVRALLLPVIFFFVCTVMPFISLAQATFEAGADTPDGGDVPDTPINGGVVLLIVAGILFGVYSLYRSQRKNQAVLNNQI